MVPYSTTAWELYKDNSWPYCGTKSQMTSASVLPMGNKEKPLFLRRFSKCMQNLQVPGNTGWVFLPFFSRINKYCIGPALWKNGITPSFLMERSLKADNGNEWPNCTTVTNSLHQWNLSIATEGPSLKARITPCSLKKEEIINDYSSTWGVKDNMQNLILYTRFSEEKLTIND